MCIDRQMRTCLAATLETNTPRHSVLPPAVSDPHVREASLHLHRGLIERKESGTTQNGIQQTKPLIWRRKWREQNQSERTISHMAELKSTSYQTPQLEKTAAQIEPGWASCCMPKKLHKSNRAGHPAAFTLLHMSIHIPNMHTTTAPRFHTHADDMFP